MKNLIKELIEVARSEACMEYASMELARNLQRKIRASQHPATAYFLSTENKRHLSNLMYVAHQTRKPIGKLKAAAELGITRQGVSTMLDETTDAGWVVKKRRGYMYSDEMATRYTKTIGEMLLVSSTNLSVKVIRLSEFLNFMSSHLQLTEILGESILQTGGEQHAETDKKNKSDAVFNEKRIIKI